MSQQIWRRSQPSLVPDWVPIARGQLRQPPYAAFHQGLSCFGRCGASLCATPLIPSPQVKVSEHTGLQILSCVLFPYISTYVLLSTSVCVSVVFVYSYRAKAVESAATVAGTGASSPIERLVSPHFPSYHVYCSHIVSHRVHAHSIPDPACREAISQPTEATTQRSGPPGKPID